MPRAIGPVSRAVFCAQFAALILILPLAAEDWPQWRGGSRDGVSRETGLLSQWPAGGPPRVWLSREAGIGYSSFAVVGDTLYTMGAKGEDEHIIALNVADGTVKWSSPVGPKLTHRYGDGPRGTPAVDGDRVYGLTGLGTIACVRAANGELIWKVEVQGSRRPGWGYSESVLVDGDRVVYTPGGSRGAIVALNKTDGSVTWQSKDFTENAHYSSILPVDHGGKRQYVQLTEQWLVGVDAANGDLLWKHPFPGRTAVIPTPIFHDGHVYATAGYGAGCLLVKLNGTPEPQEVYANNEMTNHHGGVIRLGDHLYGYSDGRGWACQEFHTGDLVWNERNERQALGKGCLAYADGKLYLLGERSGDVVLIDASPDGWNERGRFQLQPQSEQRSPSGRIWTHPVVANGKLFLRDQELLFCFDIKGN